MIAWFKSDVVKPILEHNQPVLLYSGNGIFDLGNLVAGYYSKSEDLFIVINHFKNKSYKLELSYNLFWSPHHAAELGPKYFAKLLKTDSVKDVIINLN